MESFLQSYDRSQIDLNSLQYNRDLHFCRMKQKEPFVIYQVLHPYLTLVPYRQ